MNSDDRDEKPDWGVLLANLGTPEHPDRRSVARFLRAFLSDVRVVDLPRWLWLPLLNIVIIPLRASRSVSAYRKIWGEKGSPLLVLTESLAKKLSMVLHLSGGVAAGMRYGPPSIEKTLLGMRETGVNEVVVLPLYPQFSYTTSASVYDAVDAALAKIQWQPDQVRIDDYHRHPAWIAAVAASIREARVHLGVPQMLVFSLHGIPQRYVRKGDPYEQQCHASVSAIAAAAGLDESQWLLCYQSRVGREPWLMPYTDRVLQELAGKGIKHIQVICPGFAVDCLETLEEIAIRNQELFEKAGGERLDYIPALNDSEAHAEVLKAVIEDSRKPESAR